MYMYSESLVLVINQVYSSVHLKFHFAVAISTEHWVPTPSVFCHFPESFLNLRWLNTVLAVCEYILFAKSWQEKGCSSQAETWPVKNTLMKGFD